MLELVKSIRQITRRDHEVARDKGGHADIDNHPVHSCLDCPAVPDQPDRAQDVPRGNERKSKLWACFSMVPFGEAVPDPVHDWASNLGSGGRPEGDGDVVETADGFGLVINVDEHGREG